MRAIVFDSQFIGEILVTEYSESVARDPFRDLYRSDSGPRIHVPLTHTIRAEGIVENIMRSAPGHKFQVNDVARFIHSAVLSELHLRQGVNPGVRGPIPIPKKEEEPKHPRKLIVGKEERCPKPQQKKTPSQPEKESQDSEKVWSSRIPATSWWLKY
jgi:hypothetical protein